MRKEEADRLRDIADVLDDHYRDSYIDGTTTNNQVYWFHWASQEIRTVIFSSGFTAFNDTKYDNTRTTCKFSKED